MGDMTHLSVCLRHYNMITILILIIWYQTADPVVWRVEEAQRDDVGEVVERRQTIERNIKTGEFAQLKELTWKVLHQRTVDAGWLCTGGWSFGI